jgi:DNA polymerase III sliding clamp (beta) subunit (PCNA family)
VKINRKHLLEVLQAVKPALAAKEVIEQSTSFIFADGQVLAYNDELCISHPLKVDFEGAVQAKELLALLNKLTDEEVDVTSKPPHLVVKGKKNKSGIKLDAKTNVEEITNVLGKIKGWKALPAAFVEALGFCMFSVGKDMTKPLLTCIHCSGRDVISGDNIRITVFDMGKKVDLEPLNIPSIAIAPLKSFEPIEYTSTKGWAHFKSKEDVVFSCRVMEDDYPKDKTLDFVERAGKGETVKLPESLPDALERAGIFSSGTEIKTAGDDRVRISINDGVMVVRGEGAAGFFEEENRIRYKGDPIEFECNPTFLHAILSHTDEVTISQKMLRFEGENFTHVIVVVVPKKEK